ncbi:MULTISPECIES: cell division protein FtsQ [Tatumella]|uniref:Cell division protein FtsQ n=1 Tax=Tatumella punctata TaxID=399969 RepID=A0ABW1VRV3_9GAMM|nr:MULTISPECIES: cell division protein FtsQ [unclassified Tatumella]MBS0856153.1 cell division protein FtsQ [Tatumella sp. JGM16]MBS0877435.1 cell division protein FtsQ [Tatumella sp. JGM82]MBS0891023.1 cell division protein FtsQ [Tatumella sp. JGM94]MBS0895190.1 cell division protein FtsQ [Tatumella sp. JGM130]MBS0902037.1 cell division protein FtsQ [Tatumella sp. JGM100]
MSQAALNTRNREPQDRMGSGRSNGSRLFGMIFLLLVVGTMVLGGVMVLKWMDDASRLPLSKLVVTGETRYTTHDDIRQAILSLGPPGTFMSQNVDVIQQQIERLPWIKQVSVRKQWPDELKIHLVEYVPVARWNDQNVVDADGVSFSLPVNQAGQQSMPMLYGPEGSEKEVMAGFYQMSDMLKPSKITLKAASMTARRSWQLVTSDDMKIELGRDETMKRLQRFIDLDPVLLRQAQAENKRIGYVDLRYESGAAVGWVAAPVDPQNSNQQHKQAQAEQQ